MKVKAKHNLNFNGLWHKSGETFEITAEECKEVAEAVTPLNEEKIATNKTPDNDEFVSDIFPIEETKTRGRRKSTK